MHCRARLSVPVRLRGKYIDKHLSRAYYVLGTVLGPRREKRGADWPSDIQRLVVEWGRLV